MHLPVLQPALQVHLIISINFMGEGDREVWIPNISAPFKLFWHKSACTAFPVLRLTMYSLTAYLFTKSHIAECVKSFIWLSIIERNKIAIPMSTPILFLLLLTASLAPAILLFMLSMSLTFQALFLLLLPTSLAPPALIINLLGTSSAVGPVVNSLSAPPPQHCCSCC